LIITILIGGCSSHARTPESTAGMTSQELAALCADLEIRANLDCQWNMKEQQSSVPNQQTWEINCRARRDSARESFDNVCLTARFPKQGDAGREE